LGAVIVWFFLYESRSLSLENVDRMYGEPNVKPWTSSKWTPPGYITRKQRDATYHSGDTDADVDDDATRVGSVDGAALREKKHSGDSLGGRSGGMPSELRREDA